MLCKGLATEWAEHGVRVNAIAGVNIALRSSTDEVMKEHP